MMRESFQKPRDAELPSVPGAGLPVVARLAADRQVETSGAQDIDGVAIADRDFILLTGQTDDKENGLYAASETEAWMRTRGLSGGMLISVTAGDAYAGTLWELRFDGTPKIGTDDLNFVLIGGFPQKFLTARLVKTTAGTSGLATLDGKTPVAGDYILLATGGTPGLDGLYSAAVGAWVKIANLNYTQAGNLPVYPHGSIITIWDGSAPPQLYVTTVSGAATF